MKSLLLLRHAKSSWKDTAIADHERPLNKRGKRDAARMGQLIVEQDIVPDLILCSSAKRARKTAARLAKTVKYPGVIELSGQLYLADPSSYIEVLREISDDPARVLVIGHNPGMEELLAQLTRTHHPFPTAALAHLELPIETWSSLDLSTPANLVNLWCPKELLDAE